MILKKNKIYQYVFFLLITLMMIFNGGNSNLYIQFNFVFSSIFFLFLIREKNYLTHIIKIINENKLQLFLFFFFLLFLFIQILPLPLEFLKILSPSKYNYLDNLEFEKNFASISLNPSNSFFGILNFLSLFLCLVIFKSLFYKVRDLLSFYFFIILLGGLSASVGLYFFLIGNPDFLILKNSFYRNSSTGFFINRTVFSCFLVLCFFCGAEYLRLFEKYKKNTTNNFFKIIYVRIFIIFVTTGIITSFSKIGNFLLISIIFFYIFHSLFNKNTKNNFFFKTLILIIIIDVLILGFYFGSEKVFNRFYFLGAELSEYVPSSLEDKLSRGNLALFSIKQIKEFAFFGYGLGGFETLFKLSHPNLSSYYADHAHSDLSEFIGEFGLFGFLLIFLSIVICFIRNKVFYFKNLLLFYFLITVLLFDFSLHIPIIQFLLVFLLSINFRNEKVILTENSY